MISYPYKKKFTNKDDLKKHDCNQRVVSKVKFSLLACAIWPNRLYRKSVFLIVP